LQRNAPGRGRRQAKEGDFHSAFGRNNDTIEVLRPAVKLERRADVKPEVRRAGLENLIRRHGDPRTVDLDLVMVVNLSAGGGSTVRETTARRAAIRSQQRLIKALVPLFVLVAEIPFLRQCRGIREQYERYASVCYRVHG
jgi:hypothetical protein